MNERLITHQFGTVLLSILLYRYIHDNFRVESIELYHRDCIDQFQSHIDCLEDLEYDDVHFITLCLTSEGLHIFI